jgi:predicted  nucleic acid-binding Zn-ribbon protein
MVDVITSISSAIEIVQQLRALSRKIDETQFKMLLADLTSELGDAKLVAANLKIELADAKNEIETLKQKFSQASPQAPELDDDAYIFGDSSRHYCTGCYDTKREKILLKSLTGIWTDFGKWQCPVCEKTFG